MTCLNSETAGRENQPSCKFLSALAPEAAAFAAAAPTHYSAPPPYHSPSPFLVLVSAPVSAPSPSYFKEVMTQQRRRAKLNPLK